MFLSFRTMTVATAAIMISSTLVSTASATKYELDKAHSNIEFRVKHLMVSNVKGRFNSAEGSFDFDEKAKKVKDIDVAVDAASIDTNNKDRDDHLRGADFFEVAKNPKLVFKSKGFDATPGKSFKVTGDLTMKGKTKPVTLDGTFTGATKGMNGQPKVGFELKGKLNRKDWGLTWNKALEAGGVAVSDEVDITIDAEADVPKTASAEPAKKEETKKK